MVEITGIVLAGGSSRRLGRDKAAAELAGKSLLEWTLAPLLQLCGRVLIVASPQHLVSQPSLPNGVEAVADIRPGRGPLGGLHTGLSVSSTQYNLAVACDMPLLNPQILEIVVSLAPGWQAVVPRLQGIPQTLHAVYSRECLPAIDRLLQAGTPGLVDLLALVNVRYVEEEEVSPLDPQLLSFFNVNTEADMNRVQLLLER